MSADPIAVASGGSAWVSWTANDATSCHASDGWSGAQAPTGTFRTAALTSKTLYTLTCLGATGGAVARVTVDIQDSNQDAPKVVLKSLRASVPAQGAADLQWTSVGATSCTASGGWTGSQSTSGALQIPGLQRDTSFTLTCSGPGGTGVAMTQVMLQRATLRWAAPALAGSSLKEVAGFRVLWGLNAGQYSEEIKITDPNARAQVIELPGPGTYYFTLLAFDAEGDESARSNEVSKPIPG